MTLSITLSPEQEAQLREKLARNDMQEAQQVVIEALQPTLEALRQETKSFPEDSWEANVENLSKLFMSFVSIETPMLDDEMLSREALYEDHL